MNLATSYLKMAIVQRDVALAFEGEARRTPWETVRILKLEAARAARTNMHLAATRHIAHVRWAALRPGSPVPNLPSPRAVLAAGPSRPAWITPYAGPPTFLPLERITAHRLPLSPAG